MLIVLGILAIIVFLFTRNHNLGTDLNSDTVYIKVTLNDILQSADKLNGKKVEYTGIWESGFETSNLDGKIWLETNEATVYLPSTASFPGLDGNLHQDSVTIQGTLQAEKGQGYGHMGFSPYQITADRVELLEIIK
jgi:hypothetical protein